VVRQLGGNLLLFAPFTFLLPAFWARYRSWRAALALGVCGSVFIESVQLLLSLAVGHPYRSVDVDDVILNTAGAALGYVLWLMVRRAARLDQLHEALDRLE
jgi:glycopeptide antibiotics resistance protein